jgi:hypothetical protein
MENVGVHPDIAGLQDLAHAFDLTSAALAARATLEAALERRETRGCHNRSDYPGMIPPSASTSCGPRPLESPTRIDRAGLDVRTRGTAGPCPQWPKQTLRRQRASSPQ